MILAGYLELHKARILVPAKAARETWWSRRRALDERPSEALESVVRERRAGRVPEEGQDVARLRLANSARFSRKA